MGIPDTHTMTIHHYSQTHTVVAEESSDTETQEPTPSWCRVFQRALPVKKRKYNVLKDIMKATKIKIFTHAELKKATRNYENRIGQGGYGTVFKGILPGNQFIAVKRAPQDPNSTNVMREFVNEIKLLSQINNKNVVKLLGCCFETDVPSIVYDYIPNGTLADHLFDEQNACLLTWNHRLTIAVQVAQVLSYLHNTIRVPIIHNDIKPSNILLDDNYIPIVSDFGSSKFLPDELEKLHRVTGTCGYMAPELMLDGVISQKTDVYSFGVVLAELLTSKQSTQALAPLQLTEGSIEIERPDEQLVSEGSVEQRLIKGLDEQLVTEGSMEQLKKVANLAARCLNEKAGDRPSARQVVRVLEDISGFDA